MTNLVCWAVPTRAGYVLRADRSTRRVTAAAAMRDPRFWGWRIAVVHPGDHRFSAELARRPATLAIEYDRRQGAPSDVTSDNGLLGLFRRHWRSIGLGAVLLVLSGGHWVPALAGAWLLAGRRWLAGLLGLGARTAVPAYAPRSPVEVTAQPHAGLSEMHRLIANAPDERMGYAAAESAARAIDLTDVAAVYGELARGASPTAPHPDTGWWVASSALHDPSRRPPVERPAGDDLDTLDPAAANAPHEGTAVPDPPDPPLP